MKFNRSLLLCDVSQGLDKKGRQSQEISLHWTLTRLSGSSITFPCVYEANVTAVGILVVTNSQKEEHFSLNYIFYNRCWCSVSKLCATLCGHVDCNMVGSSVLHYLLEFAEIHVHGFSVVIYPSHPLPPSFSFCFQSFPAPGSFPMSWPFTSGGQNIRTSASVLPMNIQGWFPLGLTGLISLQSKDSQESSPTPQFESINSSALSLFYGLTLTSIHDYWKNHSFDCMELCWQSDVSAFQYTI